MLSLGLIGECNRLPFDLVEAESELVAGLLTELNSVIFSVVMLSEYFTILSSVWLLINSLQFSPGFQSSVCILLFGIVLYYCCVCQSATLPNRISVNLLFGSIVLHLLSCLQVSVYLQVLSQCCD